MKTKEKNIEIIRAACVAANPEKLWEMYTAPGVVSDTPVRLADVLLALCEKTPRFEVIINRGSAFTPKKNIGAHIIWDLRRDNLEDQEPATLSFLATLLSETPN